MSLERPVLLAAVALFLAPLGQAAIPTIAVGPPTAPSAGPVVAFSIPRYSLSPKERETVASCLVLEAASQGEFGMRGVMSVIRNRAHGKPELFATTVLRQKQFSALNTLTSGRESLWRITERAKRDRMWPVALRIVDEATQDRWYDPTDGATHYTRRGEHTPWTRALACTAVIGGHAFYR